MKNEETAIDQTTMTDMLKDIFEHEENMQKYMETQAAAIKEKDAQIERLISESKKQREDFTAKIGNIKVTSIAPDLSEVLEAIAVGLVDIRKDMAADFVGIRETINRGPKPIERKFQLFSDAKTPEQYKTVLIWIVRGLLGLVGIVGMFLLIWHYLNLTHKA